MKSRTANKVARAEQWRKEARGRSAEESKGAINFERMARSLPVGEATSMLQPHQHLCLVYEHEHEWKESIIPYLVAGLRRNQKCVYLADVHTARQVKDLLAQEGVAVEKAESSGQFVILKEKEAYTRGGRFSPEHMIRLLVSETDKAIAEGYSAIRLSGEMSWALRGYPGSERLLEYEAETNRFFHNHAALGLCQYDLNEFSPEVIRGVILTHPQVMVDGYLHQNQGYLAPEEFMKQSRQRA